jgi:DNA polymerase V
LQRTESRWSSPACSDFQRASTRGPKTTVAVFSRLIRAALHGLERVWKPDYRYKKLGVVCLELHLTVKVQAIWSMREYAGDRELMAGRNALNRRYGRGTVAFAAGGIQKAWELRSDQISPAFTTRWNELLQVAG